MRARARIQSLSAVPDGIYRDLLGRQQRKAERPARSGSGRQRSHASKLATGSWLPASSRLWSAGSSKGVAI
jgi:hypothetical protein